MQITNTKTQYGVIAIILHWLMAILIIGMLILGTYMTRIPRSPQQIKLFGLHKEFGMLILMLVVVRLTWRLRSKIPTLAELPKWESFAAVSVHWLLYLLIFALPISGWLVTSAAGFPVSFFGLFVIPTIIPPNEQQLTLFSEIHTWLGYIIITALCLHIAAALKHYFIDKDKILQRMLRP